MVWIKKNFFNVYLFLREREQKRGREREGDTDSEAGSGLRAVSTEPDAGLKLTNREIMTWAEAGRLTESPRRPQRTFFLIYFLFLKIF